MPLTHEAWRDPARAFSAEDSFMRPKIKGSLDPIEVRDGHVRVRPFEENFYGHTEGPQLTPQQAKQESARTSIEVKQLVIDKLNNRRAELLARINVLSTDPAFDVRGAVRSLEREGEAERRAHAVLGEKLQAQKQKMGRVRRFFSERYGALYMPTVAVRASATRLAGLEQSLKEMCADSEKIKMISDEMQKLRDELVLVDADQAIMTEQLAQLIASARQKGWVREVLTKSPEIMPAAGAETPAQPMRARTRKRTLTDGA